MKRSGGISPAPFLRDFPGRTQLKPFFRVEKIMERIPLPAKAPGGKAAADGHVAAGGKAYRQRKAVSAPANYEPIGARLQKPKPDCPLTGQGPHLPAAAILRLKDHLIHGTNILYGQMDAAQDGAGADAQRGIRLRIISAEKDAAHGQQAVVGNYCSSFALTRYSPPPTPPNRYFPAALVLVTDTRRSWETPATSVTW